MFNDTAPKTSEKFVISLPNSSWLAITGFGWLLSSFRALCTGEKGLALLSERPLYYKNSIIHRSIPGFMIQGGGKSLSYVLHLRNNTMQTCACPHAKTSRNVTARAANLSTEAPSPTRTYQDLLILKGWCLIPVPSPYLTTHATFSLLCMANKGPNTNNSQFFVTLKDTPHLNGTHICCCTLLPSANTSCRQTRRVRPRHPWVRDRRAYCACTHG